MIEMCKRKGYGSSGFHAAVAPITFRDGYTFAVCYNCKRPIRSQPPHTEYWTIFGAYTILEWP